MTPTFFDLMGGIGGIRLGLERAGWKCMGYCENDKYSRRTYQANFGGADEFDWEDARFWGTPQSRLLRTLTETDAQAERGAGNVAEWVGSDLRTGRARLRQAVKLKERIAQIPECR